MSLMAPGAHHASGIDGILTVDVGTSAAAVAEDPPVDEGPEYRKFMGDGTIAQGWPAKSEWIPFGDM
jgi:hypothetical protein